MPIDWQAPWFAPWTEPGRQVEASAAQGRALHQALNDAAGAPVRFVPQGDLPDGMPYERFIFERRACPTRENLHDFFNGLVWLRLPRTKARLNELQAAQIAAAAGTPGRRGPVRDAITVFDENGALLQAPPLLWDALLARQWRRLFVELRPLWAQARLLVVGHALLDKLVAPRKDLTAHVWRMPCPDVAFEPADGWLAAQCTAEVLASKPFTPLPVLGIPGWCAENENFFFYDDSMVFRPLRA